jgi:hypothetical protein
MKDINYALMLLKANRFEGARDLLEELLPSDPGNQDILQPHALLSRSG